MALPAANHPLKNRFCRRLVNEAVFSWRCRLSCDGLRGPRKAPCGGLDEGRGSRLAGGTRRVPRAVFRARFSDSCFIVSARAREGLTAMPVFTGLPKDLLAPSIPTFSGRYPTFSGLVLHFPGAIHRWTKKYPQLFTAKPTMSFDIADSAFENALYVFRYRCFLILTHEQVSETIHT